MQIKLVTNHPVKLVDANEGKVAISAFRPILLALTGIIIAGDFLVLIAFQQAGKSTIFMAVVLFVATLTTIASILAIPSKQG